jgi:hypothetical protein
VKGNHGGIKNIFEAGKLRDRFESRSAHNFMRPSLGHNPPSIQHDDLIPKSENFLGAVGDIENRHPVVLVPQPKIRQNL